MRSVTAFFFALFFLAWPTLGSAQNLIPFPSFDSSSDLTNGWGNLGAGEVWSSIDVDSSPTSGSLLIINDLGAGAGVLVFSPCIAVSEGQLYRYGAWYFMQVFQPGSGFGQVALQWYDSCGGSFLGGDVAVTSTVEGDWTQLDADVVAPAGAGGVRLQLINGKSTGNQGEQREIYFDEVFLPEPGAAAAGLSVIFALTLLRRRLRGAERG
jgi:hypothetical protein